jgi:hypothetical protein
MVAEVRPHAAPLQVGRRRAARHAHGHELVGHDGVVGVALRNDSHAGCPSSMTEISTRSTIGSRRPRSAAAMRWPSSSSAAGCAS